MSGKENATGAPLIDMPSPGSGAGSDPAAHEMASGSATPHSHESAAVNTNDELYLVQDNLNQIEAILKAESKRRIEANKLTEDYILEYLDKLETSLNTRVVGQFQAMERRI